MRSSISAPSVLIDATELARMLAISKPSVWRWLSESRLPEPIRLTSQCLRWRRDAVLEWIDAGCPAINEQRPASTNGEALKDVCPSARQGGAA